MLECITGDTNSATSRIVVLHTCQDLSDPGFDLTAATTTLRDTMPAAMVPRLVLVEDIATRTSGKVDRDALPWPLDTAVTDSTAPLDGTAGHLQLLWQEILGASPSSPADDFFVLGGGSLTAAQLVARVRETFPESTVAHVYEHPTLGGLAEALDDLGDATGTRNDPVPPVRLRSQIAQVLSATALRTVTGLRWLVWVALGCRLAEPVLGWSWLPQLSWWWIAAGWLLFITPPGRMALTAAAVRFVLRGIEPGTYPRGGRVHLRLWLAERIADELGAATLSGAPLMTTYARLLGAQVEPGVDLHTIPPITGMLRLGKGSSIEPEVDLAGHWIDGSVLHIGRIEVGRRARVGVPAPRSGRTVWSSRRRSSAGTSPSGRGRWSCAASRCRRARAGSATP